jgi:hypothetical protein
MVPVRVPVSKFEIFRIIRNFRFGHSAASGHNMGIGMNKIVIEIIGDPNGI